MNMQTTGLELILNAAEGVLQIAVTDNSTLLCAQEWHKSERATEILVPALQHICKTLGILPTAFRRIACVRGPGSFTGIRLTLVTAAALRRTGQARLAGLDYMQALATTVAMQHGLLYGSRIWVLTHARRNQVHFQPFVSYGPVIPAQPLGDVTLLPPAEALALMAKDPHGGYACGSGLSRNAALFEPVRTGEGPEGAPGCTPLLKAVSPSIAALCLLARHGDYFAQDLEPLYVRSCDAVENLPQLAQKQGLDSSAAVKTLEHLLQRSPQSDI